MQGSRTYGLLAKYYDLMLEESRGPMREARGRLLRKVWGSVESACDLGCGTGTTAVEMAREGRRVFGVDLSPEMCRLAREKAEAAGVKVKVVRADMREFALPEAVDLVTCEYDAINHIPEKEDLGAVLRCVARALKPGGHFHFDVNNRLGFESYWTQTVWLEKPGVVLVMRNGSDPANDRAWSDVEWFVKEGKLWHRHTERVEEVCWSEGEMREALGEAGFDWVRAWDGSRFWEGDSRIAPGCRSVWLARKG